MAKKLIRLPGRMSGMLLRLIGTGITFLFTFFVYASGQIVQSTSSGKSTSAKNVLAKAGHADSAISVAPAYGISPMYGPIAEYGMPHAQFSIKGTIRSLDKDSPVENEKIVVQDTATKQVVDSAFTAADGSFFITFSQYPAVLNTWILEARDVDGTQNGSFLNKDTLVSIPADSLKGGSGWYIGADTVDVELYLTRASSAAAPLRPQDSKTRPSMLVWRGLDGAIDMRYSLPSQEQTRLALFGANGRLVRELFDKSESAGLHEARLETSGLLAGTYFLKLQAGSMAAITRISIER